MRDCKRVRSGEVGGSGVDGIQLQAGGRLPNKVRNIVGSNIDLHLIDLRFDKPALRSDSQGRQTE